MLLGAGIISNVEEADPILRIGEWHKDVFEKSVVFRAEVRKDVFEVSSLKLKFIAGNQSGWWSRLLRNPLDDLILCSSTTVRLLNTISKIYSDVIRIRFNIQESNFGF